ncbi:hypothetical protein GCM10023214_08220 [Amycolatopsis dongchuanensis]|uniref:Uncharacterized protein n=1 Tax=Amycolatopsis dongchuanensis TaxID=1070866 RepID=A0ABP9Q0M5_9PSEU
MPRGLRERVEVCAEKTFQPVTDGERAGRGRQHGRIRGGGPCQFAEGQRVARGLVDHLLPGPRGERDGLRGQHPRRRAGVERPQRHPRRELVQTRKGVAVAGRDQQRDRLALQPPGDEGQHVQRRAVEPLRVVHDHAQRRLISQVRQQRQNREPDLPRIGPAGRGAQSDRAQQCRPLPVQQRVRRVEHRAQQLVQTGVGQPGLGLAAGRLEHPLPELPGDGDRGVQQRALAGARLPGHDEHALTAGRGPDCPGQPSQLVVAPGEHRCC